MLNQHVVKSPVGLRAVINEAYRMDEVQMVARLIELAALDHVELERVQAEAARLIELVREARKKASGIDSLLTEYALSSEEGIALMCLAEALLRVPDKATMDELIKDKLATPDWRAQRGQSNSFFVNATTWALVLTGKILSPEKSDSMLSRALMTVLNRSSEGVLRKAVGKAMRIMSRHFVMGQTIDEALTRARKKEEQGYRYSYDMLGEAALTEADAQRYFTAYEKAIEAIGRSASKGVRVAQNPGISIKLSALHPRYQETQRERVLAELSPRLLNLAQQAKAVNIALTIDAEESERLDLSLDVIEQVFSDPSLDGWEGFGLAVQSYQKRALDVLDWVASLARSKQRRIAVRLIKGAYWDSEIKKAQMQGLSDYPVFTRKVFTDVSFQACAQKLLTMTDAIYPQFATHNAYSVALILSLVGDYRDFEFQCLHGMGVELYEQIVPAERLGIPTRVYAPVGSHEDLLPYLVRRLLENGANSSFVNRIVDAKLSISELIADPVAQAREYLDKANNPIVLPGDLFLPVRKNSRGLDFTNRQVVADLQNTYAQTGLSWQAYPTIAGLTTQQRTTVTVYSPQDTTHAIGQVANACIDDVDVALTEAVRAFEGWTKRPVKERAACLERFAELLEENRNTLLAMSCFEAGKTWSDAVAEVREAIDFCYYYANVAREMMEQPVSLKGYTGETNELSLHGRGIVVCISPWNFPLAIFTGQVVAALVTGNCVVAKPAEQTPMVAYFAVQLMLKAGIPAGVVQLLPGSGETIGAALVADERVKAVIFTGSTQTATRINQALAKRGGEIIPLIAETGGQNAMIVDSSALLEQVAVDVITSAFGAAGQRCSALRVLYVQDDVYPALIALLKGAMQELCIGNPAWLTTDVGPVIDAEALAGLKQHVEQCVLQHELIYQCELDESCRSGYFMAPTAIAIDSIDALEREVFGPVLHVIRFKHNALDEVIEQINGTGYGLTLGIHSRINQTVEYIRKRVHVGNCYVNRNMVGAVVGLQPFGGQGLSGTGPKAGGPHYLLRLCHERTYTVDTTAAGGNASLMSLAEV